MPPSWPPCRIGPGVCAPASATAAQSGAAPVKSARRRGFGQTPAGQTRSGGRKDRRINLDGVHDLGGMHGFGAVPAGDTQAPFSADWERRVFGLAGVVTVLRGQSFTPFRAAIERMEPDQYLTSPYYEHWMTATATLAVEGGMVDQRELTQRCGGTFPLSAPAAVEAERTLNLFPLCGRQRFELTQQVKVRDLSHPGHTRCPRYVRGRVGTVLRINAPTPLPDLEAATGEIVPEVSYCVGFRGDQLWSEGEGLVHVDLWDSYLEPA
jgi:nitrile hydratase beta subunit